MKATEICLVSGKIVATLEEAGLSFDIQMPGNLASIDEYVTLMQSEMVKKKQSQLIVELQSLIGVELTDKVAVFSAVQSANAQVGKLLAIPIDPIKA